MKLIFEKKKKFLHIINKLSYSELLPEGAFSMNALRIFAAG